MNRGVKKSKYKIFREKITFQLKRLILWIKTELAAIYFALTDAKCPLLPRISAFLTLAYAVSPIDLIPDFIPVVGYLDDLALVPAGIYITEKLIPVNILLNARILASKFDYRQLNDKYGAYGLALVASCYLAIILAIAYYLLHAAALK